MRSTRRSAHQLRQDLERLVHCMQSANEAESQIEEVEFQLAQETPSYYLLLSQRFVSDDDKVPQKDWEHEVLAASKEVGYNKFDMRIEAVDNEIEICFYSMEDLVLTAILGMNERVKFSTPCYSEPGDYQYIIHAFKTKKEADECLAHLEHKNRPTGENVLN